MLTASHDEHPSSTVLSSTIHSFNSHSESTTSSAFNYPEDYCHICQKHFCNKYYLKKHKVDVHGLSLQTHEILSTASVSSTANRKGGLHRKHQRSSTETTSNKAGRKSDASSVSTVETLLKPSVDGETVKSPLEEIFCGSKGSHLPSSVPQSFFTDSNQETSFSKLASILSTHGTAGPLSSSNSPWALLMNYLSRSNPAALSMTAMAAAAGYPNPLNNPLLLSAAMSFIAGARPTPTDAFPSCGLPLPPFSSGSPIFSQTLFQQYLNLINSATSSSELKPQSTDKTLLHESSTSDESQANSSAPSSKQLQLNPDLIEPTGHLPQKLSPHIRCESPQDLSQIGKTSLALSNGLVTQKTDAIEEIKEDSLCDEPMGEIQNTKIPSIAPGTTVDTFRHSMIAAKLADRVVCDICNKEVCNKYFLKTHKLKVHKIAMSSSSEVEEQSSIDVPVSPDVNFNASKVSLSETTVKTNERDIPEPTMTAEKLMDNFYSAALSCLSLTSQISSNLPVDSNISDKVSQINEEEEQSFPTMQYLGKKRRKLSEAFCHLCNKEVCSKYFLRTHLFNVHGISPSTQLDGLESTVNAGDMDSGINNKSENSPHDPSASSSVGANTDKMDRLESTLASVIATIQQSIEEENNLSSKNLFSSKSTHSIPLFPSFTSSVTDSKDPFGNFEYHNFHNKKYSSSTQSLAVNAASSPHPHKVLCDICNKWICNKYFLRTHKLNRHGYVTPSGSATQNSLTSISPQRNSSENEENGKQTIQSLSSSLSAASPHESAPLLKIEASSSPLTANHVNSPMKSHDVTLIDENTTHPEEILDVPINLSCRHVKNQSSFTPSEQYESANFSTQNMKDSLDNSLANEALPLVYPIAVDVINPLHISHTPEISITRGSQNNRRVKLDRVHMERRRMGNILPSVLPRRFLCPKCPARFHFRYLLMSHMNLNHSQRVKKHL